MQLTINDNDSSIYREMAIMYTNESWFVIPFVVDFFGTEFSKISVFSPLKTNNSAPTQNTPLLDYLILFNFFNVNDENKILIFFPAPNFPRRNSLRGRWRCRFFRIRIYFRDNFPQPCISVHTRPVQYGWRELRPATTNSGRAFCRTNSKTGSAHKIRETISDRE